MLSIVGGFFLARSTKYFSRIACGFSSRNAAKESSVPRCSLNGESTVIEVAALEEAVTAKQIGANTFHHTMKINIRIKYQRLLLSKFIKVIVYMKDTLMSILTYNDGQAA